MTRRPYCTCHVEPREGQMHEHRCLRPWLMKTQLMTRAWVEDSWRGFRSMFTCKLRW